MQGRRRGSLTRRPSCYRHGGLQRDCGRCSKGATHLADDSLPNTRRRWGKRDRQHTTPPTLCFRIHVNDSTALVHGRFCLLPPFLLWLRSCDFLLVYSIHHYQALAFWGIFETRQSVCAFSTPAGPIRPYGSKLCARVGEPELGALYGRWTGVWRLEWKGWQAICFAEHWFAFM